MHILHGRAITQVVNLVSWNTEIWPVAFHAHLISLDLLIKIFGLSDFSCYIFHLVSLRLELIFS